MDLRTGQIYETKDAALAAGVPEADVMELERSEDGVLTPTARSAAHRGQLARRKARNRRRNRIAAASRAGNW